MSGKYFDNNKLTEQSVEYFFKKRDSIKKHRTQISNGINLIFYRQY